MDRQAFRDRLARYKSAKLFNPDLKYWDFKALAFQPGGVVGDEDNRITYEGYNQNGEKWIGTNSTMNMPEVTVIGDASKIKEKENTALEIAGWLPWVGDGLDAAYIVDDVTKGNYTSAAFGAAMFALPNLIEKPIRKLGGFGKKILKKYI